MLITATEIKNRTGYEIPSTVVSVAQMMIESYVGRVEEDVSEPNDIAIMGNAVAFQAIYIAENVEDSFMQSHIKSLTQGEVTTAFVWEKFAPFMSPWASKSCEKLSWMRSRSINTGPVFSRPAVVGWEQD